MTSHNDRLRVPVLIAGGGPSGLAAAIELGHRGISCLVVEPRTTVDQDRPRAKTTSPRTMEHFRRWGIADTIRERAPLAVGYSQRVIFCTSLTGKVLGHFDDAFGLFPTRTDLVAESGQQVPQPIVENVLREAAAKLAPVRLMFGHRVTAIHDRPDGVTASVAGPDGGHIEVQADYLLGCDGPAGVSRDAIGARYEGGSGELPNLNVVFRSPDLPLDELCGRAVHYWVIGQRGGIMGRLDLDGRWWAIAQGVDVRTQSVDPAALVRQFVGRDITVDVVSTDAWVARMLLADRYRGHRTFLVGDTAHLNPPWGGHGFNTCVGDAVNIAWKLAAVLQGWADPRLLDSYQPERRPVAARTIADAAAQERHLAPALARRLASALAGAGDADVSAEARQLLQAKEGEFHSLGLVLGYHYADSPVVVDDGSPVPPHDLMNYHASSRPGTRLPHLWLDEHTSLYDVLGPDFTLLRLAPGGGDGFEAEARRRGMPLKVVDLAETHPGLAARYGAAMLLIRPDQHVAWRGDDDRRAGEVLDVVLGRAGSAS